MNELGERQNYILIATDALGFDDKAYPAQKVVAYRLKTGEWPLYPRTRNRLMMRRGDRFLIYCGGLKRGRGQVIASATMGEKLPIERAKLREDDYFISGPADQLFKLENVEHFSNAVHFRSVLPKLKICPDNLAKWGAILMGGVRRIEDDDFDLILRLGRAPE